MPTFLQLFNIDSNTDFESATDVLGTKSACPIEGFISGSILIKFFLSSRVTSTPFFLALDSNKSN